LYTADYLHVHVEAKKLAFADRAKFYADPDFYNVPIEGLISKSYSDKRRELINMTEAAKVIPSAPPFSLLFPHFLPPSYPLLSSIEGGSTRHPTFGRYPRRLPSHRT
jgi:gamma-glutamyltranspeptidase